MKLKKANNAGHNFSSLLSLEERRPKTDEKKRKEEKKMMHPDYE